MDLRGKVQKWGNSLGLRLPKAVANQLRLSDGSAVEIGIKGGRIIITPASPEYSLKELVAKVEKKNIHREIITGAPIGRELW